MTSSKQTPSHATDGSADAGQGADEYGPHRSSPPDHIDRDVVTPHSGVAGTSFHDVHLWQIQAVRDAAVIAGIVLVILCGYWLRAVTVPLLIAGMLAYLFEPLVLWVGRKWSVPRPLAAGGLIGAVGLIAAVSVLLAGLGVVQSVSLIRALPSRAGQAIALLDKYLPEQVRDKVLQDIGILVPSGTQPSEVTAAGTEEGRQTETPPQPQPQGEKPGVTPAPAKPDGEPSSAESGSPGASAMPQDTQTESGESATTQQTANLVAQRISQWVQANFGSIFQATVKTTGDAITILIHLIGSTIYIVFLFFLIPFYLYYFCVGWPHVKPWLTSLLPEEHAQSVQDLLGKMDHAVSGFVRGRIVIAFIMGILFSLGWSLCGVPYWLLLGMVTGAFCAVPYLGIIGLPIAIILTVLAQSDLPTAQRMSLWAVLIWPTVVFAIVQLIDGYVLSPLIAGKATNLGPVSILVAVLAGGAVMGAYGMLLAIPIAACIKIYCTEIFIPRVRQWATGQAPDVLPIGDGD